MIVVKKLYFKVNDRKKEYLFKSYLERNIADFYDFGDIIEGNIFLCVF